MDSIDIHKILEKQLVKNRDRLLEIQTSHYMKFQSDIQKYHAEHSDEPQVVSGKHIAEMTVQAMSTTSLDSFQLGIQAGIDAVIDMGESILNNNIKN